MEHDKNKTENDEKETNEIPEITTEEWQNAIKKLKKGKAADSNGIRAKDIKACDEETKEMVRQIFNEVIKQKGQNTRSMERNKNKSDTQKKR